MCECYKLFPQLYNASLPENAHLYTTPIQDEIAQSKS
jgi:hypothetical protein